MKHATAFAVVLAVLSACQPTETPSSDNADLTGKITRIRDADTIEVNGVAVRLNGVDAPELGTSAGRAGRDWMRAKYLGENAACDLNGETTYDRVVGVCAVDGQDLGSAVISAGYALDCRRYSGGKYRNLEMQTTKDSQRRAPYC